LLLWNERPPVIPVGIPKEGRRGCPKAINERLTFEGALPEGALMNRAVDAAAADNGM
jgi:hypothetical protein